MQVTRKIVAAAAVAAVATLGLATVVSANVIDDTAAATGLADAASQASKAGLGDVKQWYWVQGDGKLVSLDANNVGPFQACHDFVPVNGVGGQVPVQDITGIVGIDQDGNSATAIKTCEQGNAQTNGTDVTAPVQGVDAKWFRIGDDGLVSASNNNVGPFQACHNNVPINGVGGQVPVPDLAGVLGLGNAANAIDQLQTCEQGSTQNN
jgi:hypothetical protein